MLKCSAELRGTVSWQFFVGLTLSYTSSQVINFYFFISLFCYPKSILNIHLFDKCILIYKVNTYSPSLLLFFLVRLYLIPCQNFEGGHDLVGSVCVSCLAGHEVDKGLEGDDTHPVGIHYAHDAGELVFTLEATESNCDAQDTEVTVPSATH